jgi:hypothetical protein
MARGERMVCEADLREMWSAGGFGPGTVARETVKNRIRR